MNRVSHRSQGIFDASAWLDEGNGILAAACTTRRTWQTRRLRFDQYLTESHTSPSSQAWNELVGLPRASVLLLAYAVEMYLKAGLVKAYRGCPEPLLGRDLKTLYGHDLVAAAKAIDFPDVEANQARFQLLKDAVTFDARYPIAPKQGIPFHDLKNRQTARIWCERDFRKTIALALRVRKHVKRIDSDQCNPSSIRSFSIEEGGFLTYRVGGNLRPRITFALGAHQNAGPANMVGVVKDEAIERKFIHRLMHEVNDPVLDGLWKRATVLYDDGKRTRDITGALDSE
ncbi:hypothetical protein FEP08_05161 [Burkholderia multivorans]|nr:hypothetical protein [Burkholderia multivorans]